MGVAGKHYPSYTQSRQETRRRGQQKARPSDERVRRRIMVRPLAEPAGVRRDLRHGAGVRRVRDWRRFDSGMFNLDGVMNWSQVAAYLGLLAVGACLLMIAGEFDLSIGSMIGFAGHDGRAAVGVFPLADLACDPVRVRRLDAARRAERLSRDEDAAAVVHRHARVPVHPARAHARALDHVRRSHDHLRCRRHRRERLVANTLFQGVAFHGLFAWLGHVGIVKLLDNGEPLVPGIPKVMLWWFALAAVSAFILAKTRFGNWIFAVGGDANAAKNVGVPVRRVKISLFVLTAFCCVPVRRAAGVRHRFGGGGPRPAEGIRGDHRRGDRRNAADGRLWLGDRRMLRRVDLRRRADRHHLHQRRAPTGSACSSA